MKEECEHELCNRPGDSAHSMTAEEITQILDCLVARGLLVEHPDGRYSRSEKEVGIWH